MAATMLNKITPATLRWTPSRAKMEKERVYLGRIFGKVIRTRVIPGRAGVGNGEASIALEGTFEGYNGETGEVFTAGTCFLPGSFQRPFEAAIAAGEGNVLIAFALDFYATPASNPIGYSYEAEHVIEQKEEDDMLADIRSEMKALPAPGSNGQKRIK